MPVVSNTSPIWNLASIERLYLLPEQFQEVRIPTDVLSELQVGRDYSEMTRIQQALDDGWLKVKSIGNVSIHQSLMLHLDRGEAAAIALSIETGTNRVLMDEMDGRGVAKKMGLKPIGVLGVLLRAKAEGKISSLSDEMLQLRHDAGFFIAESLFQRLLKEAGEG